ncbi:27437_t:CDS:2, partial [Dentiscutata erythropus]
TPARSTRLVECRIVKTTNEMRHVNPEKSEGNINKINGNNWCGLETAWESRFLRVVKEVIPESYDEIHEKWSVAPSDGGCALWSVVGYAPSLRKINNRTISFYLVNIGFDIDSA